MSKSYLQPYTAESCNKGSPDKSSTVVTLKLAALLDSDVSFFNDVILPNDVDCVDAI